MLPPLALIGPAGSGKDRLAQALQEKFGYRPEALAQDLRNIITSAAFHPLLASLYGSQIPAKPREVYQTLGDAFRALDDHIFLHSTFARLKSFDEPWVITDVRRKVELDTIRTTFPDTKVIGCLVPLSTRWNRLTARDGQPPNPQTYHHPTEQEPQHMLETPGLCDFLWDNSRAFDPQPVLQWLTSFNTALSLPSTLS